MSEFRVRIYFPPNTPLARLQSERNSFAENARRRAEHDAQVLRDYDALIAEMGGKLEKQEVKNAHQG